MITIKQKGFTLIELMIALLLSLLVIAASITIFISILKANNEDLKMIRLTQEMRSVMTIITRDIRRAGYWDGDVTNNTYLPSWSSGALNTLAISYDANSAGDKDVEDNYQYEISNEEVLITIAGNPSSITNPEFAEISLLNFDVDVLTLSSVEIRTVKITLEGFVKSDPSISRVMEETIRVRNDIKL